MKKVVIYILLLFSGIVFYTCISTHAPIEIKFLPDNIFSKYYMNQSVNPGDDFYLYCNENWMKDNPVPGEYSRYSSFEKLEEINYDKIQTILIAAGLSEINATEESKKLGMFYNSGLDTAKLTRDSRRFLKKEFEIIERYATKEDAIGDLANFHKRGIYPFFYFLPGADALNSKKIIAQLSQGGTGLLDKDMYLSDVIQFQIIRSEYQSHICNMFELAGMKKKNADAAANTVIEIEKKLAASSLNAIEQRDMKRVYHLHTFNELIQKYPAIEWEIYFKKLAFVPENINVRQPDFFQQLNSILSSVSLNDLKIYYKWSLMNHASEYMTGSYYQSHFEFFSRFLRGIMEPPPQEKRIISLMNRLLGNSIGKLYVEMFFSSRSKEKALKMVENIKASFYERIENLEWLSGESKKKALEKLSSMRFKIGYPDKWSDCSSLVTDKDNYLENVYNAFSFYTKNELGRIDKPFDTSRWPIPPQTLNAYYSVPQNELIFPAAMLQPPFFDPLADDAVNYAAIGTVIGHEMTHGFDEKGKNYDKEGNLSQWWLNEDAENFKAKVEPLVNYFDNYMVYDSLNVDGKLTLSENIADLGGISIALNAFKKLAPQDSVPIGGFTPMQRFFIAYGQMWKLTIREKDQIRRLREDVHAPAEARVNGIVYQLDEFYSAFNVTSGKRYIKPELRLKIW